MATRQLLTISLPPAFLKDVERLAKQERMNKSELIREALRRYAKDAEWRRIRAEALRQLGGRPVPTQREIARIVEARRSRAKQVKRVV